MGQAFQTLLIDYVDRQMEEYRGQPGGQSEYDCDHYRSSARRDALDHLRNDSGEHYDIVSVQAGFTMDFSARSSGIVTDGSLQSDFFPWLITNSGFDLARKCHG
jgi:hypothetical protein